MPTSNISYKFGMSDSTFELNKHFTGIMDAGVYSGLSPESISGFSLTFAPGVFMDKFGRRIEFGSSETVVLSDSDLSLDRIDTVCVRAVYTNTFVGEEASIVVVQGNVGKFPVPKDLGDMHLYPLAYVLVRRLSSEIALNDITLAETVYTGKSLMTSVIGPTLRRIYGNIKLSGLDLSWDQASNLMTVSSGEAVISGMYFNNPSDVALEVTPMASTLAEKIDTDINSIDIQNQPTMPLKVKVTVTISSFTLDGYVRIEGINKYGLPDSEAISVRSNESTTTSLVFYSTKLYSQIDHVYIRNFPAEIQKTHVKVSPINEILVYGIKHGSSSSLPIKTMTEAPADASDNYVYIGKITVNDDLNPRVSISEEPARILKVLSGTIITQGYKTVGGSTVLADLEFSGKTGTEIPHMLGTTSYFVAIEPLPANVDEALAIGATWMDKQANKLVVFNSGSSRCKFEVQITMGVA